MTATTLEFPLGDAYPFCRVVHRFLSDTECLQLIAASEARGFYQAGDDYPPSYRNNDRQVVDDPGLARQLFQRLQNLAPETLEGDGQGGQSQTWALAAINERFRLCRYGSGQSFQIHQDGVHHRAPGLQSRLTFMIYLTSAETFSGGDTLFYQAGPGQPDAGQVIARVRPRRGSLIVFDHSLWHAGAVVTAGVKHILRSDILYQRQEADEHFEPQPFEPAHRGYVWALEGLPGKQLASGGRDTLIRLWSVSGQPVGQLRGHSQSVLGLASLGDGRLASVSRDRSLRLWSVDTRRCETVIAAHDAAALCVIRLPNGDIATGGADGRIGLWSNTAAALATLHQPGWIWALAAVGEHCLAAASESGDVLIWDLHTHQCLQRLSAIAPLRTLCASEEGRQLFTGNTEGDIQRWILVAGSWQNAGSWPGHSAAVLRLRVLPGAVLVSTSEDGYVRFWGPTGRQLRQVRAHDNFVTDFMPEDEGWALSCSYDGTIRRWQR